MAGEPLANLDMEAATLGAMLNSHAAARVALTLGTAEDFFRPAHAAVFAAIAEVWAAGDPPDVATVADRMRRTGTLDLLDSEAELNRFQMVAPSTTGIASYMRTVVSYSATRQLARLGEELMAAAKDLRNPGELIDEYRTRLDAIPLTPEARVPAGIYTADEWLARPESAAKPWVIPGLFRADWRIILVAVEGLGKTAVAQQIGLCAAAGRHPFVKTSMEPVSVLLVDLENPAERITEGFDQIVGALRAEMGASYDGSRFHVWPYKRSLNLRRRADRERLEGVIARYRPELVLIGPLYKCFRRNPREDLEDAALDVAVTFDDLQDRYGFALMIEHHVPKGTHNVRDLVPFGSAVWLKWPDLGMTMKKAGRDATEGARLVSTYRESRVKHWWPCELHRNGGLPWEARWADDTWKSVIYQQELPPADLAGLEF
jgi:replicative DNA helicase